jgi:hypothetical protein
VDLRELDLDAADLPVEPFELLTWNCDPLRAYSLLDGARCRPPASRLSVRILESTGCGALLHLFFRCCSRPLLWAVQENVSVISDLYQVPIFEKLPVLGERASVAPVAALTWSMATYFQTPEPGSCWYW